MKVELGSYPSYTKTGSKSTRKVSIKIDKWDSWNADHTLALIIHPVLVQLKKDTHGYPGVEGMTAKKWNVILEKMIFAFNELKKDDWMDQFYSGESDVLIEYCDKNAKKVAKDDPKCVGSTMKKGSKDTTKFDKRGYAAQYKKIVEGTMLFGKYYQHLWD